MIDMNEKLLMPEAGEKSRTVARLNILPVGTILADTNLTDVGSSWCRVSDGWRYYVDGVEFGLDSQKGYFITDDPNDLAALAQWRIAVIGEFIIQEESEIGDLT